MTPIATDRGRIGAICSAKDIAMDKTWLKLFGAGLLTLGLLAIPAAPVSAQDAAAGAAADDDDDDGDEGLWGLLGLLGLIGLAGLRRRDRHHDVHTTTHGTIPRT